MANESTKFDKLNQKSKSWKYHVRTILRIDLVKFKSSAYKRFEEHKKICFVTATVLN